MVHDRQSEQDQGATQQNKYPPVAHDLADLSDYVHNLPPVKKQLFPQFNKNP
jgi:hypothetical protein